jgi:23S rRNA pseudouridine1911/1915/1917 synthase
VEQLFKVIFEDADLLVIHKPADLVCHPTKTDEYSSLVGRVRLYLGAEHPGHLLNRLDRETSGVTLVAKTDTAAREIRRLWENREVKKTYLALVHGHPREDHGYIDAPLGKDVHSRVAIKDCVRPDGSPAQTAYQVLARLPHPSHPKPPSSPASIPHSALRAPHSLVEVQPRTGRKHQIRIHLAHLGHPIIGDKLYGDDEDLYLALVEGRLTDEQRRRLVFPCHALHAQRVEFVWRDRPIRFESPPEPWFAQAAGR